MSQEQQDNVAPEFPDLTSSLVSMDEIQAIIETERAVRDRDADHGNNGQVAMGETYWTENGVNYQLMNAVKEDLENLQKIQSGEYVAPPEPNPEDLPEGRFGDRQMKVWLNTIRSIEAEAKAEEQRVKEEKARAEQDARDAEERRKRTMNKDLGDSVALYILMRTDLGSLNPGKAVAQGTHAANLFERDVRGLREDFPEAPNVLAYDAWASDRGFGTAITLGVSGAQLTERLAQAFEMGCISGVCTDPTYPLRDGDVTHLLRLDTCGYVFGNREALAAILGDLDLMR